MGLTFQSETNYTETMYDSFLMTEYPVDQKQYINGVPIPPGVEIKLYKYSDKPGVIGLQFYYKGNSTAVKQVPSVLAEPTCQKIVIKLLQELPGLDHKVYSYEYFVTDSFKSYQYGPSKGDWKPGLSNVMSDEYLAKFKLSDSLANKANELPGIKTLVDLPCECGQYALSGMTYSLHTAIMHLNDNHKWTRERIADWVDTIPDLMQDFTPIEPDRA